MRLPHAPYRHSACGITLIEVIVAMGLCSIALSAFYMAAGQGVRLVKNTTEQTAASHLLEKRVEAFRARTVWTNVITITGVKAELSQGLASGLPNVTETYAIGPYPGTAVSFAVTRPPVGPVITTGASLSTAQTSIRLTGTATWGSGVTARRRVTSTILTKAGL